MESLFGLPLPFQQRHRLTKMYNDTKSSYSQLFEPSNSVKEPVQVTEDPELLLLHRKLRIQKDRLVSWGLEWSDPSQSPDIDESINKAGLSELVGSVMSTIKEILAEAEPLWQSSKRRPDEKSASSGDRKLPLIIWDKSRFEDLVRDLTMSIDTLYDVSRTRQSARRATMAKLESTDLVQPKSPVVEERAFESTRMQTPQQIDPATLIWPRDLKGIHSGMLQPAKSPRQIVFMRRPVTLHHARIGSAQTPPTVPVLLEHAPYDPIYSVTGITPSMTRFERLFAAISAYISSARLHSSLLRLIGYFEEADHSRFCLLYDLPTHFGPVDIEVPRMPAITILSDLLYSSNYEPSLEVKYRLAHNVAHAVFDLHSKGVVHGNVMSSNILFIEHQSQSRLDLNTVNMRESFLTSFDLFSDNATESSDPSKFISLHRHPSDPRTTRYTRLTSESKSLDLYSLAMLLLEIGLWSSLPDIFPNCPAVPQNPISVFKRLAARCGSVYLKAVQSCWNAPDDELSQRARPDVMHQKVFWKVSKALDACCAIDEISDTENESDDSPPMPSSPVQSATLVTPLRRQAPFEPPTLRTFSSTPAPEKPSDWSYKPSSAKATGSVPDKINWPEKPSAAKPSPKLTSKPSSKFFGNLILTILIDSAPIQQVQKPKSKLRTYPSIRISQEHLHFWHTGLMPHINHVLRGFYKKYPESVEISLESIGESPMTTKPTILVICTSVNKVRSILKKSLVYDKSIYGLKVCRGKVVRSRKRGARRSMAHEGGTIRAENAIHQDRPSNGASIGAYVNEKHLPPVSFGGMIVVDDKTYGMTVHHMLDDPSDGEESDSEIHEPILRSSAHHTDMPDLTYSEASFYSSDEEFMYELSDYESDFSDGDDSPYEPSETSEDEDSDDELEAGDIRGIPQGCGEGYTITQPAIDDVIEDFYPDPETRDEDHNDTFCLGEVYASSGIRRRVEDGTIHEIDWALFEFAPDRIPEKNRVANSRRFCTQPQYPLDVVPCTDLSDLEVHCMARTSGLQSGRILPGMVIVKIYGRQTPSSSYQVAGKLGVPGDSGAWVVDNDEGRACGHVLAWSSRKKVAYICPMEVLLKDIGETLNARKVSFPGGNQVFWPPHYNIDAEDISRLLKDLKMPPTPTEIDDVETVEVGKSYVPIRVTEDEGKMGNMPSFVKSARVEGWDAGFTMNEKEVAVDTEVEIKAKMRAAH
jgi:hypothetical protein